MLKVLLLPKDTIPFLLKTYPIEIWNKRLYEKSAHSFSTLLWREHISSIYFYFYMDGFTHHENWGGINHWKLLRHFFHQRWVHIKISQKGQWSLNAALKGEEWSVKFPFYSLTNPFREDLRVWPITSWVGRGFQSRRLQPPSKRFASQLWH